MEEDERYLDRVEDSSSGMLGDISFFRVTTSSSRSNSSCRICFMLSTSFVFVDFHSSRFRITFCRRDSLVSECGPLSPAVVVRRDDPPVSAVSCACLVSGNATERRTIGTRTHRHQHPLVLARETLIVNRDWRWGD